MFYYLLPDMKNLLYEHLHSANRRRKTILDKMNKLRGQF